MKKYGTGLASEANRVRETCKPPMRSEQVAPSGTDLFEEAPVPYFVMDGAGWLLTVNRAFCALLEQPKEDLVCTNLGVLMTPGSRSALDHILGGMAAGGAAPLRTEVTLLCGGRKVHAALNFSLFTADGSPMARGTAFDLTEMQRLLDESRQAAERSDFIAEQFSDILFEYQFEGDHLRISVRYRDLTWKERELPGYVKQLEKKNHIHPEDQAILETLRAQVQGGQRRIQARLRIQRGGHSYLWYEVAGTVIRENGHLVKIVGAVTNVDQLVREREGLMRATQVDPLTRVLNRATVWARAEQYIQGEGRGGNHAVLLVDMDGLGAVNEKLGCLYGNLTLARTAGKLTRLAGHEALVGRMGGDEFLVLLKNSSKQEAGAAAADICRRVGAAYRGERGGCAVTCSVGGSFFPDDGLSLQDLYGRADRALVSAKRAGKNGFRFYANMMSRDSQEKSPRYRATADGEDTRYANVFLVTNVLELLFGGKDQDSAVALALSIVGTYYQVSHVCVVEEAAAAAGCGMTYEWRMDKDDHRMEPLRNVGAKDMRGYSTLFNQDGLFCCYDINVLSEAEQNIWLRATGTGLRTSLQCALTEEGRFYGFLALDDFESGRVWSREDLSTLLLIGKGLGAYLTQHRAHQREERMGGMDKMVNVWSFNKFVDEAERAMALEPGAPFAMVTLDIKRFRYINDRLGYAEGNTVLAAFAKTLAYNIWDTEMVMRINSDHFGLLLRYEEQGQLRRRMEELVKTASSLLLDNGQIFTVTVSAGVYLVNNTELPVSSCLDRANLARMRAKRSHRSKVVYFDRTMELGVLQEKFVEDNMESALASGEFYVVFQPKVNISKGRVEGAEALVRWKNRQKGTLYPDSFIPVLEKTGFVVETDFFLLDRVCQKLKGWIEIYPGLIIAVNFSRVHVEHKDSIPRALEILRRWGISPGLVEIEITESAFLEGSEDLAAYVVQLRRSGFRVAMDDFGSGYSSLAVLKDLPMDVLKLDREFLVRGDATDREKVVLSSVVDMAHELGMSVVAEGVELIEQVRLLRRIGCELVQGYYFAAPMEMDDFQRLLESGGMLTAWKGIGD